MSLRSFRRRRRPRAGAPRSCAGAAARPCLLSLLGAAGWAWLPAERGFLPGPRLGQTGHGRQRRGEALLGASELSRRGLLCTAGSGLLAACARPSPGEAAPLWRSLPEDTVGPCAYPVRFTSYLTRFLLNFDDSFLLFYKASGDSWPLNTLESSEFEQDGIFARFARTVELALLNFPPSEGGSEQLLQVLLHDFGESFEARRHLCILFSLLQEPGQQPVEPLRRLLRNVENSSVASVSVLEPGEFVLPLPLLASNEAMDEPPGPIVYPWGNGTMPPVGLHLSDPPGAYGRPARLACVLRAVNATCWAVDSVRLDDPGTGYAKDAELTTRIVVPEGLEVVVPPRFELRLARPGQISQDQRKALPKTLQRKLTVLLPPFLLPTYDKRLGRLIPDQSVPMTPNSSPAERIRRLDEVFGDGRQLDRFRANFVFADFDSTYGPVGLSPFERERRLNPEDYWRLALSGGLAALLKELVFLPAKNMKYRLQTDAALGGQGMAGAFSQLLQTEPFANFYRAADVACLVALLFGVVSFGATEYIRREAVVAYPQLNEVVALVLASTASVFLALLLVAPLEVIMARVMSAKKQEGSARSSGNEQAVEAEVPREAGKEEGSQEPDKEEEGSARSSGNAQAVEAEVPREAAKEDGSQEPDKEEEAAEEVPYWGLPELQGILATSGLAALPELYKEYWLLVTKELAFVVTKFVVFDSLREAILFLVPAFAEAQSVLVACSCGAVAGAVAAVASHPLDTIFALRSTGGAGTSEGGLPSLGVLFRGVGARVVLFSPGIALLFLIYDIVKTTLGVGGSDLLQTLDIFVTDPQQV